MSAHREALHRYLRGLTQDLIARGVLRKAVGQSLDALLRDEAKTVLAEMASDVAAILGDAKSGLTQALGGAFGSFMGGVLGGLAGRAGKR